MAKIAWGIIVIWSLIVFAKEIIDWHKWQPDKDKLGNMVKSVIKYRFNMLIRMIIPAILILLGVGAIALIK